MKKPLDSAPWKPVNIEIADASAIQALAQGTADATQQKRALDWIIKVVAGTYDQSYRPGADGDRDTAFAEGKRFVGTSIVKATILNVSKLRRLENEGK